LALFSTKNLPHNLTEADSNISREKRKKYKSANVFSIAKPKSDKA